MYGPSSSNKKCVTVGLVFVLITICDLNVSAARNTISSSSNKSNSTLVIKNTKKTNQNSTTHNSYNYSTGKKGEVKQVCVSK